jgi:hypothetical protein
VAKLLYDRNQTALALPESIDLIRFEKNLLQIGFFSAHDRRSKKPDTNRRIEQWVNRNGKKIRVSAEFRSSLGLPGTPDRDKYMAFMKIAMEQKMAEGQLTNPIRFSGYSLIKVLGLTDGGENYEELNRWGMRMADTTITSEQIIYSATRRNFMNKTVHVFESFMRVGESALDGSRQTVEFEVKLADWLLENLNQSWVIPEDLTQYRKLVRPIAKGIFVYLHLWFYANRSTEVEKDYAELCALLNVRCYQHQSKIKETMGPSLDDLVKIGYLKTWSIQRMSSKVGYKLVLTPGKVILSGMEAVKRRQLGPQHNAQDLLSPVQDSVYAALIQYGVSSEKALSICKTQNTDLVRDQLEYLHAEILKDGGRRIKNPAGFVINFIDKGGQVPATFESDTARKLRQATEEEQRRLRERQSDADYRDLQLRSEYENWRRSHADIAIANRYSPAALDRRLQELRTELAKDKRIAASIDRLSPEKRQRDLIRQLQKNIAAELNLQSYEEWCDMNRQRVLFD